MNEPLKIGLLGYGRMGKAVENIALSRGMALEFIWKIDSGNRETLSTAQIQEADVVVEFSRPDAALLNFREVLEAGVPIVTGTTGWFDHMGEVESLVSRTGGHFFHAANFSLGVNLFFELNSKLARLLSGHPYQPSIMEVHHKGKKDAPSGTAIRLAEQIMEAVDRIARWRLEEAPASPERIENDVVPIRHERIDPVPGTHTITWHGAVDRISITHEALSREGFAAGAAEAAIWLARQAEKGASGVYSMKDLLSL